MVLATNGKRIRELRYDRGLTYRALAERASVNHSTIWRLETGARDGSPAILKRVADALGVTVSDITSDPARQAS